MIRHMAGVTLRDRIPSNELLDRCGLTDVLKVERIHYGSCWEKATGNTEEDMDELCGTGSLQNQCDHRRCAGSPNLGAIH